MDDYRESQEAYLKRLKESQDREEAWRKKTAYDLVIPDWYDMGENPKVLGEVQKLLLNPKEPKCFILSGSVGCGKTTLARIVTDSIIPKIYRKDERFKWYNAFEIWTEIKRVYGSSATEKGEYVDSLLRPVPFFVLDDLGTEDDTPASRNTFIQLLLSIYNYWYKGRIKMLVITTNLGINSLEDRYGERVRSRLDEMTAYYYMKKLDHRETKRRGKSEEAK